MAPKIKVPKENIIDTSLNLIRNGGIAALNARTVANVLKVSTQPIFRVYATMEELKEDVTAKIGKYYSDLMNK